MKDYFGYNNKICVVTGAASGMGKATAEMLVDMGARVYAMDYNPVEVAGIEKPVQVDLSSKDSIDAAFEKIPKEIDCFFGCAGVDGQHTSFIKTVIINFVSNKYITQQYLMSRVKDYGAIVYVASVVALRWENPEYIKEYIDTVEADGWENTVRQLEESGLEGNNSGDDAYKYSKMALSYFATAMSDIFGKRKVRINFIYPSSTDTGMAPEFIRNWGNNDREKFIKMCCGNAERLARPDEMASVMVFLCSNMASYVSGTGIEACFGLPALEKIGKAADSHAYIPFKRK